MASVQTPSYGGRYLKLTVVEERTNISDNTSTIRWTLESIGGSSDYYTIYNWGVWINGQEIYGQQTTSWNSYAFPASKGSRTGTITIKHNDDGSHGAIGFTLRGCVYYNRSNDYNGSVSLTTIARASQPSCITYPNTTSNVGNLGNKITIHMNRKSGSFTHTVKYAWGNKSGTIATGVTDNVAWEIPKNFADNIPNSTNGTGTITVDTYNGGEKIGSKSVNFTANVPDTAEFKPSISNVELSEANGVPSSIGNFVQYKSKIKGTISASGAYSSSISSYSVSFNGELFNSSTFTTGVISTVNPKINVTIKDSRGRTASYSKTITVLEYRTPTINTFSSHRNANDTSKLDVVFNCDIYNLNNKNTKSFTFCYRKRGENNYTNVTIDSSKITSKANGNKTTYSANYAIVTSDPNSSYDTKIIIKDIFDTIPSVEAFVNTIFKFINISKDKKYFAVGKLHEKDGYNEKAIPEIYYENILRVSGDYEGKVLSCPQIQDGMITFNSSTNNLEFTINGSVYQIAISKK